MGFGADANAGNIETACIGTSRNLDIRPTPKWADPIQRSAQGECLYPIALTTESWWAGPIGREQDTGPKWADEHACELCIGPFERILRTPGGQSITNGSLTVPELAAILHAPVGAHQALRWV